MRNKFIILVLVAILIIVVLSLGLWWLNDYGQPSDEDLAEYEVLVEPRISNMENRKVLAVEIKGNPSESGKDTFSKLFGEFGKLSREYDLEMGAPIGRWEQDWNDKSKKERVGKIAISVKNDVPVGGRGSGVSVEVWEYGTMAEILHKGDYKEEKESIAKLKKFIELGGYEIIGHHEEEYLRGPGMFWSGNPDNFYTIIRYEIKLKEDAVNEKVVPGQVEFEDKACVECGD